MDDASKLHEDSEKKNNLSLSDVGNIRQHAPIDVQITRKISLRTKEKNQIFSAISLPINLNFSIEQLHKL